MITKHGTVTITQDEIRVTDFHFKGDYQIAQLELEINDWILKRIGETTPPALVDVDSIEKEPDLLPVAGVL